ncbi:TadE family type IV pilus minor pilin [Streptomyces sp. YIM S03343]
MRAREPRAGVRGTVARAPDAGFVSAESAMVMPVLVLVALALLWGLYAMAVRIQCLDAARTGARAAARQDPDDAVTAVTREVAPRGAVVTVSREGDRVRVTVVARPPVPLGSLSFELREEAVASAEETVGAGTAGTRP